MLRRVIEDRWHSGWPADSGGVAPGGGRDQYRLASEDLAQGHCGFQPCQGRSEAVVRPESESEGWRAGAVEQKPGGLIENGRIAVGGGDDDENLLAGGDVRACDLLILGGGAGGGLYRSVDSEQLVE